MSLNVVFAELEAEILELQMRLLIERHSICETEDELKTIEGEMKDIEKQLTKCYEIISHQRREETLKKLLDTKKEPPLENDET